MKRKNGKMFKAFKRGFCKSFTIVELLIVIAIISILASMLMPALKSTREKAYEIKCKGNFRQIGFATGDYTGDYNSWLPFGYAEGESFSGYASASIGGWYAVLAPFFRIPVYDYYRLGNTVQGISSPTVFSCPSQKFSYPSVVPVTYAPPSTAAMGVQINSSPLFYRANLNRIKDLSGKAWLVDVSSLPSYMNPRQIGNSNNFAPRHSNGSNVLFFDSHVGWISYENAKAPSIGSIQGKGIFDTYDVY